MSGIAKSYPQPSRARVRKRPFAAGLVACALSAIALSTSLTGCRTTPITGRASVNVFTVQDDARLGAEAYDQATGEQRLVRSGPKLAMVQRAMSRLVAVTDDEGWDWEVRLVDDDEVVNAFALPGGKMAVYTGILRICRDEQGLAVVMGHEIGHVVARHGTERITRAMGVDVALSLLNADDYEGLAASAFQLLVGMPFDRDMESEADHIGLVYMARAGYDPREAIAFWERMEAASAGGPPEFLSTHPSHETRIQRLRELMPEALAERPRP